MLVCLVALWATMPLAAQHIVHNETGDQDQINGRLSAKVLQATEQYGELMQLTDFTIEVKFNTAPVGWLAWVDTTVVNNDVKYALIVFDLRALEKYKLEVDYHRVVIHELLHVRTVFLRGMILDAQGLAPVDRLRMLHILHDFVSTFAWAAVWPEPRK